MVKSYSGQDSVARALAKAKSGNFTNLPPIKGEIIESWRRCVDMFGGREPEIPLSHDSARPLYGEELTKSAEPVINEYAAIFRDNGGCLALVGVNGRLERVAGESSFLQKAGIGEGCRLSEDKAGTCAAGLCLLTRSHATVIGAEHYADSFSSLACCAAPINGGKFRFLGALCAAFPLDAWEPAFCPLLFSLAENINNQHHVNDLLNDQATMLEFIKSALLILNSAGDIKAANKQARNLLGIAGNKGVALGNIKNFVRDGAPFKEIIEKGVRVEDEETTIIAGNQPRRGILSVAFIPEDKGIVCAFEEMERVEKLAARSARAGAFYKFVDIIGNSESIQQAVQLGRMAAQSDITTLLLGESGSGKELFAHAIHNGSERGKGPFVAVNCGALPRELVQSELFGYAPGAFTGAAKNGKPGKFELADHGTIFLDEIGEMPLDAQTSLLRFIQNREVNRVGSAYTKNVDVRIIAATNRNLQTAMESGTFRPDLYYRLCVFVINVPNLRSRTNDIRLLADYFLRRYAVALGKNLRGFTAEAMAALKNHKWPGNIRELENVVEYAANIATGPHIGQGDLPQTITGSWSAELKSEKENPSQAPNTTPTLYQLERETIVDVLARFNGNMSVAAHELGIARSALYSKLARFGIDHRTFKPKRR